MLVISLHTGFLELNLSFPSKDAGCCKCFFHQYNFNHLYHFYVHQLPVCSYNNEHLSLSIRRLSSDTRPILPALEIAEVLRIYIPTRPGSSC